MAENEVSPIVAFVRAARDVLRNHDRADYNLAFAREGLRKAKLNETELAKAADYLSRYEEVAASGAGHHDGQRADRTDSGELNARERLLRDIDEHGAMWMNPRDRAFEKGAA